MKQAKLPDPIAEELNNELKKLTRKYFGVLGGGGEVYSNEFRIELTQAISAYITNKIIEGQRRQLLEFEQAAIEAKALNEFDYIMGFLETKSIALNQTRSTGGGE